MIPIFWYGILHQVTLFDMGVEMSAQVSSTNLTLRHRARCVIMVPAEERTETDEAAAAQEAEEAEVVPAAVGQC